MSKDGLNLIYQAEDANIMRLLIGRGGKSVSFYGENEFWLSLEKDGKTTLIRSSECGAADIRKISSNSLKIGYDHKLFSAAVLYKIKE